MEYETISQGNLYEQSNSLIFENVNSGKLIKFDKKSLIFSEIIINPIQADGNETNSVYVTILGLITLKDIPYLITVKEVKLICYDYFIYLITEVALYCTNQEEETQFHLKMASSVKKELESNFYFSTCLDLTSNHQNQGRQNNDYCWNYDILEKCSIPNKTKWSQKITFGRVIPVENGYIIIRQNIDKSKQSINFFEIEVVSLNKNKISSCLFSCTSCINPTSTDSDLARLLGETVDFSNSQEKLLIFNCLPPIKPVFISFTKQLEAFFKKNHYDNLRYCYIDKSGQDTFSEKFADIIENFGFFSPDCCDQTGFFRFLFSNGQDVSIVLNQALEVICGLLKVTPFEDVQAYSLIEQATKNSLRSHFLSGKGDSKESGLLISKRS